MANPLTLEVKVKLTRWPECCGQQTTMYAPLEKGKPARFQCSECGAEAQAEWSVEHVR